MRTAAWAATLVLATTAVWAAEETEDSLDRDYGGELPRIPHLEPEEAVDSIAVLPGYRVELVAAEPLLHDPVAAAFDEHGRCFVVEMRGYSERRDAFDGAVRLLTDTTGDGFYDHSTVYVDNLAWPTAIACWDGGVFVAAAPDILYCKDTTGDGVADHREVVYTGFGISNVQGLLNTLLWTFDNRYRGATSSSGGEVRRADAPEDEALTLRGRDFSFDPRSRDLRPESGGGQHGLTFDATGRVYNCHNSDHLMAVMYEDRYIGRTPWLTPPIPRISIAEDGPQAEVYRISPVEPWRVVRTRLRVQGIVPGPVEGGGRAAGYFTGATGSTVYKGDLMPELSGLAFVGDVGGNLVHRKTIDFEGVVPVARRMDEEKEFIASRDIWFRPAQFVNGPDGALYILDVYREVIEHPDSLPPIIKQHLDLDSGNDRGRLFRVVPEDHEGGPFPALADADTAGLVDALAHPNAWHRKTASRLLYTRQPEDAAPHLQDLARNHGEPLGRIHALWALHGLGALDAEDLLPNLVHGDPDVRRHAVRLGEDFADDASVADSLLALVDDEDPFVRYQLAFSLGALDAPRFAALARIGAEDGGDPWMRLAVQSSIGGEGLPDFVTALAAYDKPGAAALLEPTLEMAGQSGDDILVLATLSALDAFPEDGRDAGLEALMQGLARGGKGAKAEALASGGPALDAILADVRARITDDTLPAGDRAAALPVLGLDGFEAARPVLEALLAPGNDPVLQTAAIETLGRFDDEDAARLLAASWPSLGPDNATRVLETLSTRPAWALHLLEAVAENRIPARAFAATRIQALRQHPHEAVREQAEAVFGGVVLGAREDAEELAAQVTALEGDPRRGATVFAENCAQCHRLGDLGHEVGPDLVAAAGDGADKLIMNIVDPNREINPQYINYVIVTEEWETYSGIIASESANSITLRRALGDTQTVLRNVISSVESTELSIMPEDWDDTIGLQGVADVVSFLLGEGGE